LQEIRQENQELDLAKETEGSRDQADHLKDLLQEYKEDIMKKDQDMMKNTDGMKLENFNKEE
jgi:hypothetical protein